MATDRASDDAMHASLPGSLGDEGHVIPVQASGRRKIKRENPVRMVAHL